MKPKHKSISVLCLVILISVGLIASLDQAMAQPFAYVGEIGFSRVSVIDIGTNTVVATVPVGTRPIGIAITPDGTRAYVAMSTGDRSDPGNTVLVIDTGTNSVVATVTVGSAPFGVAITPDGAHAYVTNIRSHTVSVIDTGTNTVVATVTGLGLAPHRIAITPDGTRAYVANTNVSFSVINIGTNTVVATVPAGTNNNGMAVTPDGTRAYMTDEFSGAVLVIDTGTSTVVATVAVQSRAAEVAITPDGTRAYVTNENSGTVSVIDTGTNTVLATVPVGGFPRGVAITPDGTRVYVANQNPGTVSVIDTGTNTVVATVTGLGGPFVLAIKKALSRTPEEAIQDVTDVLQDIVDANPGTPTADKLDDVIAKLQTALDELNKEPPDNQASVGNIEGAVGDLEATVNDGLLDFAQGSDLMDQLAGVARQLASDALDFAIDQGGDPSEINDAQEALDEGDALRASASFKDAVSKYKDALAKAESAAPASKPIVMRGPTTPAADLMLDRGSLEAPRVQHDGIHDSAPLQFELYQNTPNPFNPTTIIPYTLAEASQVRLSVYNLLGQEIHVLVNAAQAAGAYNIVWDGRDAFGREVSTGLYLYRLKAGQHVAVNKMVLAK